MLRIKEVAKEKKLSMEEIAKSLDINRVSLSRNINGNPTVETLLKIANVLDVDIRDLFNPTKEGKTNNEVLTDVIRQLEGLKK